MNKGNGFSGKLINILIMMLIMAELNGDSQQLLLPVWKKADIGNIILLITKTKFITTSIEMWLNIGQ